MKFLLKKNQVLKPFNDLVSDRNDKKVLSNPIVLFFGVLWALVILGDIFFKYSGYQTVRFPLFWLLETFIYIAAGTIVLAAFMYSLPVAIEYVMFTMYFFVLRLAPYKYIPRYGPKEWKNRGKVTKKLWSRCEMKSMLVKNKVFAVRCGGKGRRRKEGKFGRLPHACVRARVPQWCRFICCHICHTRENNGVWILQNATAWNVFIWMLWQQKESGESNERLICALWRV